MTNEKIEKIMAMAVETAYSEQSKETLAQLVAVEDAVQSAIDCIDYNEVVSMTEKEAYDFYCDWALDCIMSVL